MNAMPSNNMTMNPSMALASDGFHYAHAHARHSDLPIWQTWLTALIILIMSTLTLCVLFLAAKWLLVHRCNVITMVFSWLNGRFAAIVRRALATDLAQFNNDRAFWNEERDGINAEFNKLRQSQKTLQVKLNSVCSDLTQPDYTSESLHRSLGLIRRDFLESSNKIFTRITEVTQQADAEHLRLD